MKLNNKIINMKIFPPNVNFNFHNNNYDIDSPENFQIFSNNNTKLKMEEKLDFNRISNLKDNELPLEDQLQIQKQINEDNDNDDQIEVIENILNNFGKEKYQNNKFLLYKKGYKGKYKSNSVINHNNKILNKIRNDIALINFQQEINKIHKLHNYKIFLKSERAHFNSLKKDKIDNIFFEENKNKKRIENIKKKLFAKNKEKKNTNKNNEIRKLISTFNKNRKRENLSKAKKENGFNQLLEEINNLKEMKMNNFNNNNCKTFRSRINSDYFNSDNNNNININNNENQGVVLPVNDPKKNKKKNEENEEYLKTEESTNISIFNSNQFFYTVYRNAIKKYPYLYLLKNKINKMKSNDLSKGKNKMKEKSKKEENISILDKINSQKNIFQKEIDKYKSKS